MNAEVRNAIKKTVITAGITSFVTMVGSSFIKVFRLSTCCKIKLKYIVVTKIVMQREKKLRTAKRIASRNWFDGLIRRFL